MLKDDDRWLSVDEIGEYLGIGRDTVYAWLKKHGLPARRVGRLWKFRRTEVDEWMDRHANGERR